MPFLEELAKIEEGEKIESHSVYDCIKAIRKEEEPEEYKLFFYFFGTIKDLKKKLNFNN